MKKLTYLLIAVFLLSALPQVSFAQSDDPFEQETLKTNNNGNIRREKKINRKKNAETETTPQLQMQPVEKPANNQVAKPANNDEMTISNPCSDWLDFEFISLVGSRGSQTIKLTFKITNHDVNKSLRVGSKLIAFDNEGDEHSSSYIASGSYNCMTDVPVKISFDLPEKANPANVKKLNVIGFNIDDCRVEMRNVPIEWR